MRVDQLLNVGTYSGAQQLRARVAHSISFAQITSNQKGAPSEFATKLAAFLADAASKTPGYAGPVLPENQVLLTDGVALPDIPVTVDDGEPAPYSVTVTVEDGVITGITLTTAEEEPEE